MLAAALCFSLCLLTVSAQQLEMDENDICKQKENQLWTCQKLSNCSSAQADLKKGKRPEICSFIGREAVVCCQPSATVAPAAAAGQNRIVQPKERISTRKCREYAQYVYTKVEDMMGDGYHEFDTCAVAEPLITNGTPAEPREFPHMALIGYGRRNIKWLCGGSLISERFVLSAAHCTRPDGLGLAKWVRLGDYNRFSREDDDNRLAQSREYEIMERINHPEYKPPSAYNDIALYKLKENVKFNEFVRPICLQIKHRFPKTYAIATGWGSLGSSMGQSAILQKVNLTIIRRKKCEDEIDAARGPRSVKQRKLPRGINDPIMFCAGDADNGKDTCQGDSGGPLQIRLRDPYCMYSQVGVIASGHSSCFATIPGLYTRVSHYVPWIESIVWP